MSGPLHGVRAIEMAGIGPGPFCAMLLADMGAEVIRIHQKDRKPRIPHTDTRFDVMARGRRSMAINLKKPGSTAVVLKLIARADVLIEGFRPGVMERLGLGPKECFSQNPRLVIGRMTGWGQYGPLANTAGHDINYISLTGVLNAIGRAHTPPAVPLNLVGDFGGGGLMLAFGIVCALLETKTSGKGQIVDAAMTDGAALLAAMIYGLKASGIWSNDRGANLLDGGAHFYNTYECADGKYVSVGAIEPQFYDVLLEKLAITDPAFKDQMNRAQWLELKQRLAAIFRSKTRDEWARIFEGSDACFAPILDWDETPHHHHNRARETYIEIAGVTQPAPAPRFSRTEPRVSKPPSHPDEDTDAILADWGVDASEVVALRENGAI
jgi:alpha-methylacyl-CoA racemase